MHKLRRSQKETKIFDKRLLFLIFLLTVLGLIAVADASAPQALIHFSDKYFFVKQQLVWMVFGVILMIGASFLHYSFWEKIALPLFLGSLLLLVIVLVPGVGTKLLGARRWLEIGSVSIQPSEIVKLTLAIYLAKVSSSQKGFLSYFLPLAIVGILVMLEPDLGTTLVIIAIGTSQIFVSGVNLFYLVGMILAGGVLGSISILVSDYRRARLLTFLKSTQDPLGRDYHIRQILLALGSGGLFGVGLGQSRQKYLFLPEASTDSIFAIIAEEVGFIGALFLIFLFILFVYYGFKIAKNAPDKFGQTLAIGIITWIGGQTLLNIGSMVALVPLTGIPLPFFSYGGSALTMILLSCGILLSISRYSKGRY